MRIAFSTVYSQSPGEQTLSPVQFRTTLAQVRPFPLSTCLQPSLCLECTSRRWFPLIENTITLVVPRVSAPTSPHSAPLYPHSPGACFVHSPPCLYAFASAISVFVPVGCCCVCVRVLVRARDVSCCASTWQCVCMNTAAHTQTHTPCREL